MFDPLLEASREATYTGIKVLPRKILNFGRLAFIHVKRGVLHHVDENYFSVNNFKMLNPNITCLNNFTYLFLCLKQEITRLS